MKEGKYHLEGLDNLTPLVCTTQGKEGSPSYHLLSMPRPFASLISHLKPFLRKIIFIISQKEKGEMPGPGPHRRQATLEFNGSQKVFCRLTGVLQGF